jgi:dethiobiotin synthetase
MYYHTLLRHILLQPSIRHKSIWGLIRRSTDHLMMKYEIVLTEGAGGLMVPIVGNYTVLDYISDQNLPIVLVTSTKLGSINHTLLSLHACKSFNIQVMALIYNVLPGDDELISKDSFKVFEDHIQKKFPKTLVLHGRELTRINPAVLRIFF